MRKDFRAVCDTTNNPPDVPVVIQKYQHGSQKAALQLYKSLAGQMHSADIGYLVSQELGRSMASSLFELARANSDSSNVLDFHSALETFRSVALESAESIFQQLMEPASDGIPITLVPMDFPNITVPESATKH